MLSHAPFKHCYSFWTGALKQLLLPLFTVTSHFPHGMWEIPAVTTPVQTTHPSPVPQSSLLPASSFPLSFVLNNHLTTLPAHGTPQQLSEPVLRTGIMLSRWFFHAARKHGPHSSSSSLPLRSANSLPELLQPEGSRLQTFRSGRWRGAVVTEAARGAAPEGQGHQ